MTKTVSPAPGDRRVRQTISSTVSSTFASDQTVDECMATIDQLQADANAEAK